MIRGILNFISTYSLVQLNTSYHNFNFNSDGFQDFQNLPAVTDISSSNAQIMTIAFNYVFEYRVGGGAYISYLKAGSGLFRFLPKDIEYSTPDETGIFESDTETTLMLNSTIGFLGPMLDNIVPGSETCKWYFCATENTISADQYWGKVLIFYPHSVPDIAQLRLTK